MTRTHDPTPRQLMTGIGGWRLGRELGRGAYALVRQAVHESGHSAACKILPALHNGKPYNRDRMMDAIEAHKELVILKALAGAGVPGVVGMEGVITHQGWNYIFLKLYPQSVTTMDFSDRNILIPFFRRLCINVNLLHSIDLSHEDLKRSNILASADGQPILADFGFAHFTPYGGLVKGLGGTAEYSSPEKNADEEYLPTASEVWSLGVILLRILGYPYPYAAYDGEEEPERKHRMRTGQVTWPFSSSELLPGRVGHLIQRMMEPEIARRYTIQQVLAHPFLQTDIPDPEPFVMPRIGKTIKRCTKDDVVLDVAFLAFNMKEFFLCESLDVVRDWILWEQKPWTAQWAAMLGMWKRREETMWEDVREPTLRSPVLSRKDNARAGRISLRPLREIRLPSEESRVPNLSLVDRIPQTPPKPQIVITTPRKTRQRFLTSSQAELEAARPSNDKAGIPMAVIGEVHKKDRPVKLTTPLRQTGERVKGARQFAKLPSRSAMGGGGQKGHGEITKKPIVMTPLRGSRYADITVASEEQEADVTFEEIDAVNEVAPTVMESRIPAYRPRIKSGQPAENVEIADRYRLRRETGDRRARGTTQNKENIPPPGENPAPKPARRRTGANGTALQPLRRSTRHL